MLGPYSVVLFDEIEKAHPDVFNILLQILEDGIVTDSQGRTVSFKNAIIIMTSNIGSAMILNSGKAPETLKEELTQELRAHFRPEFLNRIDEILTFHALGKEEIRKIVDLLLEKVRNRLAAQEITLEVSEEAKNFIGDAGFDPDFGARPLKRAVIQLIETPLSRLLIANTLLPGMNVKVSCSDGKLEFTAEQR